ncbi:uncharacterized protein ANIA_11524 [Aspergillus nidulans FGSC A4]|uniref:Uncharacterized protein n=1 Tax=Emericella nidulans (strain FGSC A4 / ATCC 38163 / CBS 112.46 / NRRL 194 / M139) TaxID=227321 RepID=C8V1E8_EMENI|nr:hypothetical protein [Aspergillus nidulans FGSC A4]CBF71196.1 TPA: hypothetical protein ANIA_11524 [Aspergillus nidulans FGSC A4]
MSLILSSSSDISGGSTETVTLDFAEENPACEYQVKDRSMARLTPPDASHLGNHDLGT